MVDHNDRDHGSDDLYDETTPRSIFAATWFRAVLVLIVLGVIGAVAVPYILDAMNAPPGRLSATAKPPAPVPGQPPAAMAPPAVSPAPTAPPSSPPTPTTPAATSPTPLSDKSAEKNDTLVAGTPAAQEPPKPEPKPAPRPPAGTETVSTTEPKPAATADSPTRPTQKVAKATTSAAKPPSGRQWFVQVGAFKDAAAAKKVAAKLREDKYTVEESTRGVSAATVAKATAAPSTASGADQYDVIVSGGSPEDVTKRLAGKSLTAQPTPNGVVVKPSLPLRDAVALSKELAVDGLKVQVRRAGGAAPTARASSTASASAAGSDTLYRVSVGGFSDRAKAVATLKELEAKGYKPFLTRR
jgi:cell division septation protein DedD